jgi:type I restriction enzyme R subunit
MNQWELKEKQFESDIEASLCTDGGYTKGNPAAYDRDAALDRSTFLSFIQTTQPKQWQKYVRIYGSDAEKQIVTRFNRTVKLEGLLYVLRHGFVDRGLTFQVVYWKPETTFNQASQFNYDHNILHCTRQLHYCPNNENSVDIVLFLNGIPVVSLELKCQFTGQTTSNAINQYKFDRSSQDPIFRFKERILVHFAVDLANVYITTRLQGSSTYFMPFNQGSNGGGRRGGAGNPPAADGHYQTGYLWERVLTKDSLLEILHKYMHLQTMEKVDKTTGEKTISERMIFPRFHQLDCVSKLLADVKAHGSGRNYLVEHSAGSGKSNSIAWLAYRLSSLHDAQDKKIFQSVIIVTDRRVLDKQLQDTVYQFDHVAGVVCKVDQTSQQLKKAIEEGRPIIITTLQKFPVIYDQVETANNRFAVIVDEAHSSQTGDAAKKLKYALADTDAVLEEAAREEEENEVQNDQQQQKEEDKLLDRVIAAQGNHDNLSFFAFTATPKAKTLQAFGQKGADGKYYAYHIYSMRQAIEEGFILDVLKDYVTYQQYYQLVKTISDNPVYDTTAGTKAVLKYASLHPHNIAQKTEIMLSHFYDVTRHKLNGRAKAMVVTPSRLHAVRYYQEFKRQIKAKNLDDLDILVAFSGTVTDKNIDYTEEGMNKTKSGETIKETQLPEAFKTDDYGILVVAEKYQTGFDEPLLHTMFVDKKLTGVKAVQTLSRLNRTMPGKIDTFVLDFVNTADTIKKSFEPFYEETVLEKPTDPNVVYDIRNTLDGFQVYRQDEIEQFAKVFYDKNRENAMAMLHAAIRPAIDRYNALPADKKDAFRTTLNRFGRIYSFVTQVCRLFDKDLHKFSVYAKYLAKLLPRDKIAAIDVDDKVLMEYFKLEETYDGSILLDPPPKGFTPITGETGHGQKKQDPLGVIIDQINQRFGTEFTEMDKILLQIENDYAADPKWHDYANSSDFKTFMLLFEKEFLDISARRYQQNDAFFMKLFNNPEMINSVVQAMGNIIYNQLHEKNN